MSDKDFIKQVDAITDPVEALEAICEYEDYLGYDPYYREMRAALMRMIDRVIAKAKAAGDA